MNKKLYFGLGAIFLVVVMGVGIITYKNYRDDQTVIAPFNETIDRPEIDLAFSYPSGELGFSLIEPPITEGGELVHAFVLMPTNDYIELTQSTDGRESPPAISIFVFNLPDTATSTSSTTGDRPDRISRLQNWALTNTILTSYGSALGTPEVVEIDGVKLLHYRADGLYQQDIYLASYKKRAFMFVGQFNSERDITFTTFQDLMKTVSFN